MNSKSSHRPCGSAAPKMVAVSEVFYRREMYYTGGGGCCTPRRTSSDMTLNSPSNMNWTKSVALAAPSSIYLAVPDQGYPRVRAPPNSPQASGRANSTMVPVPTTSYRSKSTGSLQSFSDTGLGKSTCGCSKGGTSNRSNMGSDMRMMSGNSSTINRSNLGPDIRILSGNSGMSKVYKQ